MKKNVLKTIVLLVAIFSIQCRFEVSDRQEGKNAYSAGYSGGIEEKTYCKATIEDDFAEDTVVIVINNQTSL